MYVIRIIVVTLEFMLMWHITQLPNIFGVNLIGRIVEEKGGTPCFLIGDIFEFHESQGLLMWLHYRPKNQVVRSYKKVHRLFSSILIRGSVTLPASPTLMLG